MEQPQADGLSGCDLIVNLSCLLLPPVSGLIACTLNESGDSHGRKFKAKAYASAVWTKCEGRCLCLFSRETGARC